MMECSGVYRDPSAEQMLASGVVVPRRMLLLDRDGVINVDRRYVHTDANTSFIPGIFDLCSAAHEAGYLPVVVTNQAGVARGLYSEMQLIEYTAWMHAEFAKRSAPLLATYYCPHHPEEGFAPYVGDCDCRKPKPGMLLRALRDYAVDPSGCVLVGDKSGDIEAGVSARVGTCLLLGDQPLPSSGASRVERIRTLDEVTQHLVAAIHHRYDAT